MAPQKFASVYNLLVFLAWTVTSFLCHFCAKVFLMSCTADYSSASVNNFWKNLTAAGVLTLVQIAMCNVSVEIRHSKHQTGTLAIARLTHVLATLATNLSMSLMFASSTLAIKLMEPITSALSQFCVTGTPLTPVTLLSLPVIVAGAIAFTGNPLTETKFSLGFSAAFASNFILAFRNLAIKKLDSGEQSAVRIKLNQLHFLACCPLLLVASLLLTYMVKVQILHPQLPFTMAMCLLSGVFHVSYSYVSTGLVLTQMSVVSHAVTNIMKRVLVVLLLYMVGKRVASLYNFLGLAVCTLGLFIYTWEKQRSANRKSGSPSLLDAIKGAFKNPLTYLLTSPLLLLMFWGTSYSMVSRGLTSQRNVSVFRQILQMRFPPSAGSSSDLDTCGDDINLLSQTFRSDALKHPEIWQLEPDLDGYLANESSEIDDFLQERILPDPDKANFLCPKLRTSAEVIKESQRIHYNLLGDVLRTFKYAVVLDTADFENKGDPAITVGEFYFLTRLGIQIVYYCDTTFCLKDDLETAARVVKNYSVEELVICLHGGGNINIYRLHDPLRAETFERFRGYQFFMFPQSIFVGEVNELRFNESIRMYCCNENFTMVLRDYQSYDFAKKYFNGSTRLLVAPDMAFHIGPVQRFMPPVFDILWIRREDSETPGYQRIPNPPPHLRVHVSDWLHFKSPTAGTSFEKSIYVTTMGLFFTQRGRVVVTDRIHGHIFSTLLDIPHVLLDNKARKLSSYHNSWTKGVTNTRLTNNTQDALRLALELLDIYGKQELLPPRAPWLNISSRFAGAINFTSSEEQFP